MNKKSILLILLSTLALGANAQGKYTSRVIFRMLKVKKYICILATWGTWILTAPSSLMVNLP